MALLDKGIGGEEWEVNEKKNYELNTHAMFPDELGSLGGRGEELAARNIAFFLFCYAPSRDYLRQAD